MMPWLGEYTELSCIVSIGGVHSIQVVGLLALMGPPALGCPHLNGHGHGDNFAHTIVSNYLMGTRVLATNQVHYAHQR